MANSILLIKKRGTNYLKKWLFLVFPILATNCCAQISFEKGYYIDNSNQKVDCLIKNVDWKNNPTSFEYKLSD